MGALAHKIYQDGKKREEMHFLPRQERKEKRKGSLPHKIQHLYAQYLSL